MKIIFTLHAEKRMKKRKLSKEEIIKTLRYPKKIIKRYDKYYVQKEIERGVIEIIYEKTENYIRIITIYWIIKWK